MVITYRKGNDQPGKVANPARGKLNRENKFYFPCPRSHYNSMFARIGTDYEIRNRWFVFGGNDHRLRPVTVEV